MELCDYCGLLDWTIEKYGRVTHKQSCPHRTDPWHQGDPQPERPGDPYACDGSVECPSTFRDKGGKVLKTGVASSADDTAGDGPDGKRAADPQTRHSDRKGAWPHPTEAELVGWIGQLWRRRFPPFPSSARRRLRAAIRELREVRNV